MDIYLDELVDLQVYLCIYFVRIFGIFIKELELVIYLQEQGWF